MNTVSGSKRKWKTKVVDRRKAVNDYRVLGMIDDVDVRISLIQALIPIGMKALETELQREVETLAGERYRHGKDYTRWGKQDGSAYLLDQKLPIKVPRIRDKRRSCEIPLETYQKMQQPYGGDEKIFKQILHGLSMRRYEESASLAPEMFGISGAKVSGRFKRATIKKLRELQSRNLDKYDFTTVFLDGKRFSDDGIVVALGITLAGEKIVLGIEQMSTENHRSVEQFFNKLIERGLRYNQGILFVVDGSKGLLKAIRQIFQGYALIQRCRWHKQENVVSYLNKGLQGQWRKKIQVAYSKSSHKKAHAEFIGLANELESINASAANSLREGLEEVLTLHKLGLYNQLKRSFSSTNCIESLLSQVEHYTQRVDRWRNGSHIQRWVAGTLLEIEPRLNKVSGYKYLALLRNRLQENLDLVECGESVERETVNQGGSGNFN